MSQHDYDLADQNGAAFRADLNNVLNALVTYNAGDNAPAVTFPNMVWADTSNNLLKRRNATNNGWITDGKLSDLGIQTASQVTATAQGTADIISASFTPMITALTTTVLFVRATAANTTTTPTFTPNVGVITPAVIVKESNQQLVAGDIKAAGYWMMLLWDATLTKWVLLNPGGTDATASAIQSQTYTAFTTSGTATAYTLAPNPAIVSNATGLRFRVKFALASGTSPTLAVSGKTALPLVYRSGTTLTAITSTQLPINWESDVVCTGTQWLVLEAPIPAVAAGVVFTSSGTWTVPSGVTAVKVTVTGGGGGGGDSTTENESSGGGGAGGTAIDFISDLTPGSTITVTVGAGGAHSNAGGTSSFGSYCTATGGAGGTDNSTDDVLGGTATGGVINQSGGSSITLSGGASYWGQGGVWRSDETGQAGVAYGSGGGGTRSTSATDRLGGAGRGGIVLIEW